MERLPALALSQPLQALAIANQLISGESDPALLVVAHQAAGISMRESGRYDEAVAHLKASLRLAEALAEPSRISDVRASLGVTLVSAGRTRAGLAYLDDALRGARGLDEAKVRVRRANAFMMLGRGPEALHELGPARALTRRFGDRLWEARCLVHLGWARSSLGRFSQADADAHEAGRTFDAIGQLYEAAWTVNNRAYYAFYAGDLPRALGLLDEAEQRFAKTGPVPPHPAETRCRVLLAAGLAPEALATARAKATDHDVPPLIRAEFMLVAASAALVVGDVDQSLALAAEASALFAAHRRHTWRTRARFVESQAHHAAGQRTAGDLTRALHLASQLTAEHSPEATLAHLLAGRLALEIGHRWPIAEEELSHAASGRHTGSALTRATGWLATALHCAAHDNRRGLLHACRRGLDALDEYRVSFGDIELRALATEQGRDLAGLALDAANRPGRHRDLLWWSERWRATALTAAPVRPPEDPELATALARAREAGARLTDPSVDDAGAVARAERDRSRQEAAVRRRTRQLAGAAGAAATVDVSEVVAAVGSDALVSLVDVRGILYAVLVTNGRVTRREVGPTAAAVRESEFARFTLRRTAYGRPSGLAKVGALAQDALLGDLATMLPERVVIVPPAALHATPWGLLPAFTHTRLSVAPSARLWLRARARPRPDTPKVTFVTGPGLTSEATEAATVSPSYAGATVLSGGAATVAAAVPALEGTRLAHVAAHGTFRSDAPMFSSLHLADGPLYIHDFDRLQHPPHTLVLSACDAGDTAAVGVDEGLGLVTSLLGLGTSAVLASVVPVNDAAAIPVMGLLHRRLAAGDDLASALRHARVESQGDVATHSCAMSFTAWAP